jgi:hypothetical protein
MYVIAYKKNLIKIKINFLKNVKNSFKKKSKPHFTLEYLLFLFIEILLKMEQTK